MAILLARINDTGMGYCPACETMVTGRIITGNPVCMAEGQPVSYMNCTFQGGCGHTSSIISSSKNQTSSQPMARLNDTVHGCINGRIITGSPTVLSD